MKSEIAKTHPLIFTIKIQVRKSGKMKINATTSNVQRNANLKKTEVKRVNKNGAKEKKNVEK